MEYATIEVNLDDDIEMLMVQNWVNELSEYSRSVYNDSIANGTDFRIAFYEAKRNEEIINALQWQVDNNKDANKASPKFGTFGDVV